MGLQIKLIAFLLGLIFLSVVLRNVRQNVFLPIYAVLWLGISTFLLSVTVLEPTYKWIATTLIGINDARHIIYVALIGFLLIYNLHLTARASRMSNQIRQLISAVAILEARLAEQGQSNRGSAIATR